MTLAKAVAHKAKGNGAETVADKALHMADPPVKEEKTTAIKVSALFRLSKDSAALL
jgi:hypothetical protein